MILELIHLQYNYMNIQKLLVLILLVVKQGFQKLIVIANNTGTAFECIIQQESRYYSICN